MSTRSIASPFEIPTRGARHRCAPAMLALWLGCTRAPVAPPSGDASASPFSVLVEGLCPKLEIHHAGDKTLLVYGSYGLDEPDERDGGAAAGALGAGQSFAELKGSTPIFDANLLAGLPRRKDGWIAGDVEIGGRWPDAFWLALVETARTTGGAGALFERRRSYYSWEQRSGDGAPSGSWQLGGRARHSATPGTALPELADRAICKDGLRFANYTTARLPSGDTMVAGRCEDPLGRSPDGIDIASYRAGAGAWRIEAAPPSELFADIVNIALVIRSRSEAYLYAYPPYVTGEAPAYLVRFDGERWQSVPLPFEGPLVALGADDRGALWAITGWRTLRRFAEDRWQLVPLPPARFVHPAPARMRLLDVQSIAGAVWIHAAYPALLDGAAARGHILYTTRAVPSPLYCDRRRPPDTALSHNGDKLQGAQERR